MSNQNYSQNKATNFQYIVYKIQNVKDLSNPTHHEISLIVKSLIKDFRWTLRKFD